MPPADLRCEGTFDGTFAGELAGVDDGNPYDVVVVGDISADFRYHEVDCEFGVAEGSGDLEGVVAVGTYGTGIVTGATGTFDFAWNRTGTAAVITDVEAWITLSVMVLPFGPTIEVDIHFELLGAGAAVFAPVPPGDMDPGDWAEEFEEACTEDPPGDNPTRTDALVVGAAAVTGL